MSNPALFLNVSCETLKCFRIFLVALRSYQKNQVGYYEITKREDKKMRKKVITIDERAYVEALISEAQKRAKVRLVNYGKVKALVDRIDRELSNKVKVKDKEGIEAVIDPNAQVFSNHYVHAGHRIPESTVTTLRFTRGKWRVVSIERARCDRKQIRLTLPRAAKEALIEYFENDL